MLLQMVYTRDVNQLSSGAEPALTLLQRESAAPGKRELFVYEATRGGGSRAQSPTYFPPVFFFLLLHTRSPVGMGIDGPLSSSKAAVAARRCLFREGFERETWKQATGGLLACAAGRAAAYPPGTETHRGVSATSAKATYHHTRAGTRHTLAP